VFESIRQDYAANRKPINIAGFRVLLIYRFGRWRMTIKTKLLRVPFSYLYRQLEKHVRFKYGIELPYTVELGERVTFEHQHGIVIHGNAKIGHDCIIRQGVTIGNKSVEHPLDAPSIGHHVNIGAGAKILGKVTIGNYVDIGANAVVTKDIPDGAVAVGIPAKVIKIKSDIGTSE
jgi:serine O-acetyltransferase